VSDPTVTQSPRLMTAQEVATLCGVEPRTVHRWGRTGKLTPRRTPGGGGVRYLRSEVYDLMDLTDEGADQ
jgi:DNA-binding transcriptional MerR regulator